MERALGSRRLWLVTYLANEINGLETNGTRAESNKGGVVVGRGWSIRSWCEVLLIEVLVRRVQLPLPSGAAAGAKVDRVVSFFV